MDENIRFCKQCGRDYKVEEGYNDECCCVACATEYDERFTSREEDPWDQVMWIALIAACC